MQQLSEVSISKYLGGTKTADVDLLYPGTYSAGTTFIQVTGLPVNGALRSVSIGKSRRRFSSPLMLRMEQLGREGR